MDNVYKYVLHLLMATSLIPMGEVVPVFAKHLGPVFLVAKSIAFEKPV
jgi:hypothetical protein